MWSPVTAVRDFSRRARVAKAMYDNLARRGRPGGVDVSRLNEEDVAALMYLLDRKKSEVTVVKNRRRLTLMFISDVDVSFSREIVGAMYRGRIIASPTDDLFAQDMRDAERPPGPEEPDAGGASPAA
jgi:hypothetical protein